MEHRNRPALGESPIYEGQRKAQDEDAGGRRKHHGLPNLELNDWNLAMPPAFVFKKILRNMKAQKIVPSLIAAAALTFGLIGCGQKESATAEDANKAAVVAAEAANKAAELAKAEAAKAADAAKVEAARVADAAKAEAEKVAAAAKVEAAKVEAAKVEAAKAEAAKLETAKVEAAKAAASAKTQELIVKATSLVAEGKYSDASSVLQQLAGQALSSDQQKLVDGLKAQIQTALVAKAAENAAGSVGDLLKK